MKKSTILTMLLAAFAGCLLLTGCGNEAKVEKAAVEKMNQQLKEMAQQMKVDVSDIGECTAVKITEKVDDTHYKATATLTSKLTVAIRKVGDKVEIMQIPAKMLPPEIDKNVGDQSALEKAALEEMNKEFKEKAGKNKGKGECTAVKITGKVGEEGFVGTATTTMEGPITIEQKGEEITVTLK